MSAEPNWALLTNSLLVATASTLCAFVFGFCYAVAMSASPRGLRRFLLGGALVTLAMHSFLVANSWIDLLGLNGLLRPILPLNVFSLAGAIWILSLTSWPIPAIVISSAWPKLERIHLEVDPALRGFRIVRWLLWPTARSLALTSLAVVFALALGNFAVPAILQVKVFSAEAWVQFNTNLDAGAARRLCWPLLIAPLLLLIVARQREFPWPRETREDFSRVLRRQLGWPWLGTAMAVSALLCILAIVLPLTELFVSRRTWSEFLPAAQAGIPALINSVAYAAATATLTMAAGLLLARVPWLGWLWLFFFFPGILLGISAVEALNRPGLEWFSRTSLIVIALLFVRYLALSRSICRTVWQAVDPMVLDAGRLDGATGLTLFRCVTWPQISPQVTSAGYLVYLLCLWDVETIVMVIPPGGETLALRVFNLLHYGHNAHVNALCILLLFTALAPLVLFASWKCLMKFRDHNGNEATA
jgi:ABC-type Fe3+ transport system permease subunit